MIIRKFSWDDFPEIVRVTNEFAALFGSKRLWSAEELEEQWRAPHNDVEANCFVGILLEMGLAGYLIVDVLDVPNQANGVYRVLPTYPELGSALIRAGEAYFRELAEKNSAPNQEIFMLYALPSTAEFAFDLLKDEGYSHTRNFYHMCMDLTEAIPDLALPDGLRLRSFQAHEAQTLYQTEREIFQEHWGNYEQSFEEWIYPSTKADFDPNWWLVLLDGEEIIGFALSEGRSPETSWISTLGIKAGYRQRGLAQQLLQECFRLHQSQGRKVLELGVDADNENKASSLYLKAGMQIRQTLEYYRKTLREAGSLIESNT